MSTSRSCTAIINQRYQVCLLLRALKARESVELQSSEGR